MARFRRFGEQMFVFRKVFIGPPVFKTNFDNDSDIDQSGCTALPTCRRHVVNGTHCVGVSVLTNRLRKTHARGGHWEGGREQWLPGGRWSVARAPTRAQVGGPRWVYGLGLMGVGKGMGWVFWGWRGRGG